MSKNFDFINQEELDVEVMMIMMLLWNLIKIKMSVNFSIKIVTHGLDTTLLDHSS